jgi:hypothetical protein
LLAAACASAIAAQRFQLAELVVAHAQAVARLAGVDGVGAEGEGGAHHRQRTGGGEQFGRNRGGGRSDMGMDGGF